MGRHHLRSYLFGLVFLSATEGALWAQDPLIVDLDQEELKGFMNIQGKVLYQKGQTLVVLPPEPMGEQDFKDLYIVETGLHFAPPPVVEEQGKLLGFVPGKFALMRLNSEQALKVASDLHGEAIACGALLKLQGDLVATDMLKLPEPVVPLETVQKTFSDAVAQISPEEIKKNIDKLTAFPSRFHKSPSGKQVADFLMEEYQKLSLQRSDVSLQTIDHGSLTPQKSLVVRIEGTTSPDEILILGSHLDSVNWRGNGESIAPGADDNASGTATNLEIFRVLMASGTRFERTLEIHAYAAEEIGLVGSQDIAQRYKREGKKVLAMVQHDMTLWKPAQSKNKIWFVTNNTDSGFNLALGKLVDQYVKVPWEQKSLSGGSSDHASWRRAGFVTAFPFEDPASHNPAIHTARDTTAQAPYFDLAAEFARLGLSFALHYAGG